MRDPNGRFDPSFSAHERAVFDAALNRAELHRILTTPFSTHGHANGVTPDRLAWALDVCRTRPAWALPVFHALGMKPPEDTPTP